MGDGNHELVLVLPPSRDHNNHNQAYHVYALKRYRDHHHPSMGPRVWEQVGSGEERCQIKVLQPQV